MRNNHPKISIITPSLNGGTYINQTIESVLKQNYPNIEFIIVDQGSSDETINIIKKYKKRIILIKQKRKGISSALNLGLRKASGEIIGWINTDDFYLSRAFNHVVAFFKKYPYADWLTGDYIIVDEKNHKIRSFIVWWKRMLRFIPSKYTLLFGNYIVQPSTFLRRKITKETGIMDKSLKFNMDLDYWFRIIRMHPLFTLTYPLSAFRVSDNSLMYRYHNKSFREQIKVYRKYFKTKSLIEIPKIMNFIYAKIYSFLKKYKRKKFVIPERIDALTEKENKYQKIIHLKRYKYCAKLVKEYISIKKPKILDAGCGFGYGSTIIKKSIENAKVTGVDINKNAISYANKNYKTKDINFKTHNIKKLPFKSCHFDAIFCLETLEHLNIADANKTLREFYRLLTPGGVLFISSPNKFYTLILKRLFKFKNPYHLHEFKYKELINLLLSKKFRILKTAVQLGVLLFSLPFYPKQFSMYFIIVAEKK